MKSITFKIMKEKDLIFPTFKDEISDEICLIPQNNILCCKDISCEDCIFYLRNYREFINSKGE